MPTKIDERGEKILRILRGTSTALKVKDIKAADVTLSRHTAQIFLALKKLVASGQVVKTTDNRYILPSKQDVNQDPSIPPGTAETRVDPNTP